MSELADRITIIIFNRMLEAGSDLVSEEGENPEYDRAIYELIRDTAGLALPMAVQGDGDAAREYVAARIKALRIERG